MSNWNKNVNIYGNLNKLIVLGVLLSIPLLVFGIYLWSRYLAARIIVWVVIGLVGIGLFSILLRWTKKAVGIRNHNHPVHSSHHNHGTHHHSHDYNGKPYWKRKLEKRQKIENSHHKHKHH